MSNTNHQGNIVLDTETFNYMFLGDISGSITIQDKKYFATNENILKEHDILQSITATNNTLTASIVKYIDFSETLNKYYIIAEHGGINLLHYVTEQHCLMRYGNNGERKEFLRKSWKKFVFKYIFSMISTLNWLHDICNIVHLDVSLNNYTFDKETDTIKLIDFGLAEMICDNNFRINKFVGKTIYKCPEINNKITFDGRKADSWSVGVCFYMMYFGIKPWERAVITDEHYRCIINGHTKRMLKDCGFTYYATGHHLAYDFIHTIFKSEDERPFCNGLLTFLNQVY